MRKFALIIAFVALAGCQSGCSIIPPAPKTPAQAVYEAQETYRAALKVEVYYDRLPRCGKTSLTICSDLNTVKQVRAIDIAAWGAIRAAQTTVRTKGFMDNTLQSAAIAAVNAANAFASVTSQLRTH